MKNLEVLQLGVVELSAIEQKQIDGGFICGGICIATVAFVAGLATVCLMV